MAAHESASLCRQGGVDVFLLEYKACRLLKLLQHFSVSVWSKVCRPKNGQPRDVSGENGQKEDDLFEEEAHWV